MFRRESGDGGQGGSHVTEKLLRGLLFKKPYGSHIGLDVPLQLSSALFMDWHRLPARFSGSVLSQFISAATRECCWR